MKEFSKYFRDIFIYFVLTFVGSFVSMFIIGVWYYIMVKNGWFNANDFTLDYLMNQAPYTLIALGSAGLILIIFMYFRHWRNAEVISFKPSKLSEFFVIGMGINFLLSMALGFLLPADVVTSTNADAEAIFQGNPLLIILVTALIVPIFEEVIFRGFLLKNKFPYMVMAKSHNVELSDVLDNKICFFIAALIQAVLFGIMHGNLVQASYATLLGLLFAYADKQYNSLVPSICMHCGLNFYTAIYSCFPSGVVLYLIVSICGLVLFLYETFRRYKNA